MRKACVRVGALLLLCSKYFIEPPDTVRLLGFLASEQASKRVISSTTGGHLNVGPTTMTRCYVRKCGIIKEH